MILLDWKPTAQSNNNQKKKKKSELVSNWKAFAQQNKPSTK